MLTVEDFMKTASEEQKDLLFKMSDVAEEENQLIKKLNNIQTNASNFGFDSEYVTIASVKPKQELKEVKEKMKTYMEKAIELGMKNLGIIQRNYEHYVGKPLPIE